MFTVRYGLDICTEYFSKNSAILHDNADITKIPISDVECLRRY